VLLGSKALGRCPSDSPRHYSPGEALIVPSEFMHFHDERMAGTLGRELTGRCDRGLASPLFLTTLLELRFQALLGQLLRFLDLNRSHV
jgi:hypothetical protein